MYPRNSLQQKELKKIKTRVQFIGCLAVVITQAGITLYLPSLPAMQHDLHTTSRAIAFSLTAYMAGYAFPMLFWGALSDYLGRRKSLLIAISVFTIASFLLIFTSNIGLFIFFRFIQGAGGGGSAIIGRSAIRDVFEKVSLVKAMSYVSISFIVALGVFQTLGGLS